MGANGLQGLEIEFGFPETSLLKKFIDKFDVSAILGAEMDMVQGLEHLLEVGKMGSAMYRDGADQTQAGGDKLSQGEYGRLCCALDVNIVDHLRAETRDHVIIGAIHACQGVPMQLEIFDDVDIGHRPAGFNPCSNMHGLRILKRCWRRRWSRW